MTIVGAMNDKYHQLFHSTREAFITSVKGAQSAGSPSDFLAYSRSTKLRALTTILQHMYDPDKKTFIPLDDAEQEMKEELKRNLDQMHTEYEARRRRNEDFDKSKREGLRLYMEVSSILEPFVDLVKGPKNYRDGTLLRSHL